MASRKSSRVNPKYKTKYRVGNWPEYERGLRSRGDVTIWFDAEAISAWSPPNNGRRGGQRRYSNIAIVTALTVRIVFHLPLRQTEGFVASLLRLMDLDVSAPDQHHAISAQQGRERDPADQSSRRSDPSHPGLHRPEDLGSRRMALPQAQDC